ncbi:MAG: PepSY-associated TM helix domain-containing protein, partial [Thalassolituus sp.]
GTELGVAGDTLVVKDGGFWRVFNPDYLVLGNDAPEPVKASELAQFPAVNSSISLQRIVLDIHSGRWFGSWGIWMMDLAAVVLILLSISGLWLWWSRGRNRW